MALHSPATCCLAHPGFADETSAGARCRFLLLSTSLFSPFFCPSSSLITDDKTHRSSSAEEPPCGAWWWQRQVRRGFWTKAFVNMVSAEMSLVGSRGKLLDMMRKTWNRVGNDDDYQCMMACKDVWLRSRAAHDIRISGSHLVTARILFNFSSLVKS